MKSILAFVLLATIALVVSAATQSDNDDDDVEVPLILTDKTFKKETRRRGVTLVFFHAPWSDQSRAFEPEFVQAADTISRDPALSNIVTLAKIDAVTEQKSAKHFKVDSFPTLKLFKLGAEVGETYTGERTAAGLVEYMRKKATQEDVLSDKGKIYRYTRENSAFFDNSSFSVIRFILSDPQKPPRPIENIFKAILKSDLGSVRFAVARWKDFEAEALKECTDKAAKFKCCVVGQYAKSLTNGLIVKHALQKHPFTASAFDKFLDRFLQKVV